MRDFNQNGFSVHKGFYNKDIIQNIQENISKLKDYSLIQSRDIVFENDNLHYKYIQNINYYEPSCNKVIDEKLLKLVSELLDESAFFINMEIHDKAPRVGTKTPAHQDNFYFRLSPPSALTVYIPLEKHDAELNGGLCFVKGSHKNGTQDHHSADVKAFSSELLMETTNSDIYKTKLEAGDIVVHHCNTIHFADSNNSGFHRRSLSLRFNGRSAQIDQGLHKKYIKNYKLNRNAEF